jgi:hypothetical protein
MTEGTTSSPLGALPLAFTKMSGAGNDFLIFGERAPRGEKEIAAIRRLCRRGTGVGADGVLFVTPESPGDPSSKPFGMGGIMRVVWVRHEDRGPAFA